MQNLKVKKYMAFMLALILLFCSFPHFFSVSAGADTTVTEPEVLQEIATTAAEETEQSEMTEAAEEQDLETLPEENTSADDEVHENPQPETTTENVTEDDTEQEEILNELFSDVDLPEKFHTITVTDPAPLRNPVKSAHGMKMLRSSANITDNLVLNKTVTDHGNETFTLTLESYATGTASVVTKVPVPSDVILVLDESGSMNDCIECGHEMTEACQSLEGTCLHKVFLSELDTAKKYKTYYTDKTERVVGYCSSCRKWYTGGPFQNCSGHGTLGYWVAFSSESDKASYANKVYVTQFYAACDHDTQRMDALKGAVTSFLDKMYASSIGKDGIAGSADDVDNTVAIVGYDNDTPARIYTPKETVSAGYVLADSASNATGTLKHILSEKASVTEALSKVRVRSATATNRGMEAANLILTNNPVPAGQQRNRVVILFTDGSPGSGYENNKAWANGAIQHAYTVKQSLGATVYTIGLFWGADASDPFNLPPYDVNANGVNNLKFFQNGNRFLHLVSSNYPNAVSLDNTGSVASLGTGGSYYLSADDEAGLYSIFGKLSSVVTPGSTTVTLDDRTVVKDIVTPYFELMQTSSVTAWTESYCGENTWVKDTDSVSTTTSGPLSVKISGNTVSVSNFHYAQNYVAADKNASEETVYRGKKLMIRIGIQPVAGFLGGDEIETNTSDSAIYARASDDVPVKQFPVPDVDVPVKQIHPEVIDKDIYLSQLSYLPQIVNPGTYRLTGSPYTVDTIRNGYADIVYTISDPGGKIITCTIPAGSEEPVWDFPDGISQALLLEEDVTYQIGCHVMSVNNKAHKEESQNHATVHVYRPEIVFEDSAINLGQTADYRNNAGSVSWIHGTTPADTATMGEAPELQFSYDPEPSDFRCDTPVRVTVAAKKNTDIHVPEDRDITQNVLFWRDACSFTECDHNRKTAVSAADSKRINFIVHLNTFDLRIEKNGADISLDPNCSFLFRIYGPDAFVLDVVIHGNGSALIKNLPVGDYKVTELKTWSWRYDPEEEVQTVNSADIEDGIASLAFKNIRSRDQWLDGEHYAENHFTVSGTKQERGKTGA